MAKRFFIRKSAEEVLRDALREQHETLKQLMVQQEQLRTELAKRKPAPQRGEDGKFVSKVTEEEDVYIPQADFLGEATLHLSSQTQDVDNQAVEKARKKKK